MKISYIYYLADPDSPEVPRYVGKSFNPTFRHNAHLRDVSKTRKANWIKSLKTQGKEPLIFIIDEVLESEWKFWESYWISQFKAWGFILLNHTSGGDGVDRGTAPWNKGLKIPFKKRKPTGKPAHNRGMKMSIESRKKMSDAKKGKPGSSKGKISPYRGKTGRYSEETLRKMSEAKKKK